jgi:hypothetical protein
MPATERRLAFAFHPLDFTELERKMTKFSEGRPFDSRCNDYKRG